MAVANAHPRAAADDGRRALAASVRPVGRVERLLTEGGEAGARGGLLEGAEEGLEPGRAAADEARVDLEDGEEEGGARDPGAVLAGEVDGGVGEADGGDCECPAQLIEDQRTGGSSGRGVSKRRGAIHNTASQHRCQAQLLPHAP